MELVREESSEEDTEKDQLVGSKLTSKVWSLESKQKSHFKEEGKSNNQGSQERQKDGKLRTYHKILKYRGF